MKKVVVIAVSAPDKNRALTCFYSTLFVSIEGLLVHETKKVKYKVT